MPRTLLRLEGLAVFLVAIAFYHHQGGGWVMFLLLVLVPDVSLLAYAGGARFGAIVYNGIHTYVGPALLLAWGRIANVPLPQLLAAIWAAHIGIDRLFGYGLKGASFKDTRL